MTIATSSNPYHAGAIMPGKFNGTGLYAILLLLPAIALLCLLVVGFDKSNRKSGSITLRYAAGMLGFLIGTACLLAAGGCGYSAPAGANSGTQRGMTTVMITATSGNLTHTTSVSLTVQ
jgi:hypothetical protein